MSSATHTRPSANSAPAMIPGSGHRQDERTSLPDIGHLAKWSVSSFKFGFGPECLRDDDPETFWHSDGPAPHFIILHFPRKTAIQKLSLHLSFPLDDSYTPSTLCLRAGTSLGDLQDIRVINLDKPNGWVTFDVSAELTEEGQEFKPIYCYVLQIIILSNHMNGKDTHVRGLHVLGPPELSVDVNERFATDASKFIVKRHTMTTLFHLSPRDLGYTKPFVNKQ